MPIPGNLLTTAMAVMPHTDVDRAMNVALSTDIPFWPQLPNYSYYEDMYVQAAEHLPGILLDIEKRSKSLLSPATCCLVNPDKEKTVEKAFQIVKKMSLELRKQYQLSDTF